jgi:hypothetical protein
MSDRSPIIANTEHSFPSILELGQYVANQLSHMQYRAPLARAP